ncbi:MAG TPA: twin-arginine translocation signal domain-containing protein, partial [Candidatus Methylomirabilis sp.]|nr:twin-arginine translocation signal domain-containing protein [Candidatus Methylomirabilis sp.]
MAVEGRLCRVHVPNSGRLQELLHPGAAVRVRPGPLTGRRTRGDLAPSACAGAAAATRALTPSGGEDIRGVLFSGWRGRPETEEGGMGSAGLTRRGFLRGAAGASAAAALPAVLRGQVPEVKVGAVHPVSGLLARVGQACRS